MRDLTRREFLRATAAAAAGTSLFVSGWASCAPAVRAPAATVAGWDRLPDILARIRPPVFPDRLFDITRFGAIGDGARDCTGAIRQAIAACRAAGGGRVLVPTGRFLTGPVHLHSNVELHVSEGGTLAFSRNPADYLPLVFTRWEGVELLHYSPLIYAFEQENVAITGQGTLDGQADALGRQVMELWAEETWKYKTLSTGRQFRPGMLSWNYWIAYSDILPASPDGRQKGKLQSD
jgi:polygalacturonase